MVVNGFTFPIPRGTKVMWIGPADWYNMTNGKEYTVGGKFYDEYMVPGGVYHNHNPPYIVIEADNMGNPNGWECTNFKCLDGPW